MGQWDALAAGAGGGSQFLNAFMSAKQQAMQNRLAEQKAAQEAQIAPLELAAKKAQLEGMTPTYDASQFYKNAPEGMKVTRGEGVGLLTKTQGENEAKSNERKFKNSNTFRDEYNQVSKPFLVIQPMYKNVESSASTPNPTAATDMGLIFSYMKILDPNSTVREGEYATAAKAGSFGDQVKNAVQQLESGQKLTPAQRANFLGSAKSAYASARDIQKQHLKRYTQLAKRAGVDPEDVVFDYSGDLMETPGATAPAFPPANSKGGKTASGVTFQEEP